MKYNKSCYNHYTSRRRIGKLEICMQIQRYAMLGQDVVLKDNSLHWPQLVCACSSRRLTPRPAGRNRRRRRRRRNTKRTRSTRSIRNTRRRRGPGRQTQREKTDRLERSSNRRSTRRKRQTTTPHPRRWRPPLLTYAHSHIGIWGLPIHVVTVVRSEVYPFL